MRVPTAAAMQALGRSLAAELRAGDLVLLIGDLGAGKTTLAQGIGAGLEVPRPIRSPTFVLARLHRGGRIPLMHVDAYQLGSGGELDDLDLDAALAESVTVVEWGEGLAEVLAPHRLEVRIWHPTDPADEGREVAISGYGDRWAGVPLPG